MKTKTFLERIPLGIQSEADVAKILNQHKYQGKTNWKFRDNRIKFSDEQNPVDWFYAVQIAMELINPSAPLTTLPGAERFFEFLCSRVGKVKIKVHHPIVLDTSYDIDYSMLYKVFVGSEKIGEYKTFGPNPEEKRLTLEFSGFIPGYINKAAIIHNRHLSKNDRPIKLNSISLCFSNRRFEAQNFDEGPGRMVKTPWQRQDGHETIPFP
ncbi:MAG TPA: hypothetical protein VL335_03745 [Candidatus Paceibacterota bacterium]|jgi:hypothetical protein|nr:hypothetical protein [Candidatus Paceibacterota bacterium]